MQLRSADVSEVASEHCIALSVIVLSVHVYVCLFIFVSLNACYVFNFLPRSLRAADDYYVFDFLPHSVLQVCIAVHSVC